MFDLQLSGNLETVGDVRVEERHEPLLVKTATACSGAGLSDASGIAAVDAPVEQTVLQVHVSTDCRPGRGEERLGVDELAAAGASETQRLLAEFFLLFLGFFLLLGLVLRELLHQPFQPPDPFFERLLGLLVGYGFERGAAQKTGWEGPEDD